MRILYQPTQGNPTGWKQVDSSGWAGLSSFTCHALCVQGVVIDGFDHYSVEPVEPGVVKVIVWNDDLDDWPVGQRWAREICFRHLAPDPDPGFGGALNTCQTHVIYAEAGIKPTLQAAYGNNPKVEIKDWTDFNPNRSNPMGGQWVADGAHAAHVAKRSTEGWRTWTEGLDPSELDAQGRVKVQRAIGRYEKPKGTRTYYHNATDLSIPAYTADNSNALGLSPAGSTNENSGNVGGNGALGWAAATPANEPSSAAWPTTGTYRYQIDCVAAGVDLTYGLLTQGTDDGGFVRINSALDTELQRIVQSQSAFFGSGLFLATVTNPAWTAGASSDRFAIKVAAVRVTGHGTQTMTLQVGESDDFADGPWSAAPAPPDENSTFFGSNF
jgi:hypothetical protein